VQGIVCLFLPWLTLFLFVWLRWWGEQYVPGLPNDHVGQCLLHLNQRSYRPDEPVLGNCVGERQLQFRCILVG
jgi:hypothetical protein